MRIAIVGTGISGTTLALRLQQLGIETTVFAEKTQDDIRSGRLLNTVARFEHTVARERELGVDLWTDVDYQMTCLQFRSIDPLPLSFVGRPAHPVRAVDFRVLLPAFLDAYEERGGSVVEAREPDLTMISSDHELVVVAVGRRSAGDLFSIRADRSPYNAPQRMLFAGIFDGLALPDPLGLSFNIAPGIGELFQMPILTSEGPSTNILVEAIPGGPLAALSELAPDDPGFNSTLRRLLDTYAPAIAERVDPATFGLRSPRDALQGALTPAVREAYATLPDGTPTLAIGDAWITNDPLTGQGANIGSHCAWVAAERIAAGGPFDAEWGRRVEDDMWAFAGPTTAWTNAFLQPPPPHVIAMLFAAAEHQGVADAFASGFGDPVRTASLLADPAATEAFISSVAPPVAVGASR
jgi:2-polyprenyl-6-methoxyphenol hydroxylase-like FAD-dependent oxidoreductase